MFRSVTDSQRSSWSLSDWCGFECVS